jgi:putative protease
LPFVISKVLLDLNEHSLEQFLQTRTRRRTPLPPLVWCLPSVIGEERLTWYREAVQRLRSHGASCFQIGHVGQVALFAERIDSPSGSGLELYGEYSCNALNSSALRMYAECGLSGVQFSLETDRATLAATLTHFARQASFPKEKGFRVGLYVHGRPPLFSARLDAPHFQGQRSFASSRGERFYLDRRGETVYAFSHTTFSLLPYVDDLSRMGVEYFVVDISQGQGKKECGEVTALLSGRGERPPVYSGNFVGALA